MTGPLLHTWNLNLGYAKRLVADIPDDTMALQPAPGMNHAAWVLGHLACTADMLGAMIGVKPTCPADWAARFDWNSSPSSEASQYPSKATLLQALEDAHATIAAALPFRDRGDDLGEPRVLLEGVGQPGQTPNRPFGFRVRAAQRRGLRCSRPPPRRAGGGQRGR